ncbi:beta-lactamase family protein [Chloroflexi bacterium TSY]|nr:beta-lactamase family protein [Chloroflexi bacterium TSY]
MTTDIDKIRRGIVAIAAKQLCSGIFVSGRNADEVFDNTVMVERMIERPAFEVDEDRQMVTTTLGGHVARSRYYGDQGCSILPPDSDDVNFTPQPIRSTLPDPRAQMWPMGDLPSDEPYPTGVDQNKLAAALETAFANPADRTAAYLVLHQGQIIGERYGAGAGPDTQLESWSMGKSITAALIGILVSEGHFTLDSPAPIPAWRDSTNPRSAITIAHLLRMSSGLLFSGSDEPAHPFLSDHNYPYTHADDMFAYAIEKPLEHPPNTVGRYRNCDPLTLGYIIRRTVEGRGEDYLSFPQRALFDRIGIRRQMLECDLYGNFILTGFDFGTARNWARFGLLHLNDGMWQGERILPEGWVDFVSSPAPAWENGEYGGQFWVNSLGEMGLPTDTFSAMGVDGQKCHIIPSRDLVIVRLGHRAGGPTYEQNHARANQLVIEAVS